MPALELYPYQRQWIGDKSRFKIGMFARQTGKTFTTTLEIVDSCLAAASQGGRERWVILSRGERQAKEAMDEGIKRHAQAYGAAFDSLEYDWKGEASYKALEVTLPGGSRITGLPANPDTARGFSASCFLDEFAFHQDSKAIWKALFPVISAGHRLRITSTPNGKENKFYELMTGESRVWSRHVVDIHRAVADGLPRDIAELREGLDDEDAWTQEYELQWLDEASAWLSYDLINAVEHDAAGEPVHYQGGPCYLGVDIGRRKDLFVIWVLELVGDVFWARELITRQRATFKEQDALLAACFDKYTVVRCCMDQTGMGEKPVEDAKDAHGQYRVEGVLFTGPAKQHLATLGKEAFQDRRLRSPRATRVCGGICIPSRKSRHPWARRGSSPRGTPIPTPTGPGRCSWPSMPAAPRPNASPTRPCARASTPRLASPWTPCAAWSRPAPAGAAADFDNKIGGAAPIPPPGEMISPGPPQRGPGG